MKVGDKVWWVPTGSVFLVVEVVIQDMSDDFSWIGESFGLIVCNDNLFPTKDEAMIKLQEKCEEYYRLYNQESPGDLYFDLYQWRDFDDEECNRKVYGLEWFTPEHLSPPYTLSENRRTLILNPD